MRADSILLLSYEAPELRVAQLRDGRLFDFNLERGSRVFKNIYKGRIKDVVPGMDAAFIDIGLGKNAMIYSGDILPANANAQKTTKVAQLVRAGQQLVVQASRPPVGSKGARVTTKLTLAGRYAVLDSAGDGVGISRKISASDERARLRKIAERYRPLNHGIIIRTEADGAREDDLARDINWLHEELKALHESAQSIEAPAMLRKDIGLLGRTARDRVGEHVSEIWIDTKNEFDIFVEIVKRIAPELVGRIHLYQDAPPLFEKFGIVNDICAASKPRVNLPSGGEIVFAETEALCTVDVNTKRHTGRSRLADTVLKTNLEAVKEVARQLRFRDIGGIIIIDFIDMDHQKDRISVLDALEAELKTDPVKSRIVQLSPSGIVEIIRQRESSSLRQVLHRNCPYCDGEGVIRSAFSVAIDSRRKLREMLRKRAELSALSTPRLPVIATIKLHPEAASAMISSDREFIAAIEKKFNVQFLLYADRNYHLEASEVRVADNDDTLSLLKVGQKIVIDKPDEAWPIKSPRYIVAENSMVRIDKVQEIIDNKHAQQLELTIRAVNQYFCQADCRLL